MLLDVGGVFFVPDHELVSEQLGAGGVEVDREGFRRAHYLGMHRVDTVRKSGSPFASAYLHGVVESIGVADDRAEWALGVLRDVFNRRAASDIWCSPVPGSAESLRTLSSAGVGLAIVSNSDGTVEGKLREMGVCQVGPGDGVPVGAVVDSGVAGVSKPDPAIFTPALKALNVHAGNSIYVGDSVHYDVGGARAAGLHPIHFDPYGLCDGAIDHDHVASLDEVVARVG